MLTVKWSTVDYHYKMVQYLWNDVWVNVNNNFFVMSEVIRQWFSSRMKIIAVSPHKWQKNHYSW